MRALAWIAAAIALACAPLVAILDGLHAGQFADAPAYAHAIRRAAAPLLDFADPLSAMRVWQAVLGVAVAVSLGQAWRARVRPWPEAARLVAWCAAALLAAGAVVEAVGGESVLGTVGVAAYFLATPIALLAAPVAGVAALARREGAPKAARWLAAAPLLVIGLTLLLPHIPGAPLAALAVAWAGASSAEDGPA